jgi:hypothetical protein
MAQWIVEEQKTELDGKHVRYLKNLAPGDWTDWDVEKSDARLFPSEAEARKAADKHGGEPRSLSLP